MTNVTAHGNFATGLLYFRDPAGTGALAIGGKKSIELGGGQKQSGAHSGTRCPEPAQNKRRQTSKWCFLSLAHTNCTHGRLSGTAAARCNGVFPSAPKIILSIGSHTYSRRFRATRLWVLGCTAGYGTGQRVQTTRKAQCKCSHHRSRPAHRPLLSHGGEGGVHFGAASGLCNPPSHPPRPPPTDGRVSEKLKILKNFKCQNSTKKNRTFRASGLVQLLRSKFSARGHCANVNYWQKQQVYHLFRVQGVYHWTICCHCQSVIKYCVDPDVRFFS